MAPFPTGTITLVGYGNQGRAWAHNLRDSGWHVSVSGRPESAGGVGMLKARADGFAVVEPAALTDNRGLIALLLPDLMIGEFFMQHLGRADRAAGAFVFAHGFCVLYKQIKFMPQDDVILVAPKGIGVKLREKYVAGSGVMGVLGVEQNASGEAWQRARAVATALGCGRVKILESTFAAETEANLLAEQVLLCGGVPRLLSASIEHLKANGIPEALAIYQCLDELKLIVDMMVEHGIHGMLKNVSPTAAFGGLRACEKLFPGKRLEDTVAGLHSDIRSGKFTEEILADKAAGFVKLHAALDRYKNL